MTTDGDLTRSQVERAGKRIRHSMGILGVPELDDLVIVDLFRARHYTALQVVQSTLTRFFHSDEIGLTQVQAPITSRLKTPRAIVDKLCRSKTALSRMQDIAGARIVLPNVGAVSLKAQDAALELVKVTFDDQVVRVKDQRDPPDPLGYRPLHVIVRVDGVFAEIQIRTAFQDRWAQVVELLDKELGADLKHGRGPDDLLVWLRELSEAFWAADHGEDYEVPAVPGRPGATEVD